MSVPQWWYKVIRNICFMEGSGIPGQVGSSVALHRCSFDSLPYWVIEYPARHYHYSLIYYTLNIHQKLGKSVLEPLKNCFTFVSKYLLIYYSHYLVTNVMINTLDMVIKK